VTLTANQLCVLQHMLGLDQHGRGAQYRNHYCIPVNAVDDDFVALAKMEGAGYTVRGRTINDGRDQLWHVTDAGVRACRAASPPEPKLTRSQQRYRAFLRADFGCEFGEWLKTRKGNYD